MTARSALYRSKAWGVTTQPDFVNAAALLETRLAPHELLRALKRLETELGRIETFRWGPRVIDLDILAYDDVALNEPGLVIPHARLFERAFVLVPLAEIDPTFGAAAEALREIARGELQRIPGGPARSRKVVNWERTLERVRASAEFCAAAGLARFRSEDDDIAIEIRRTPQSPRPAVVVAAAEGAPKANGTPAASNGARDAQSKSILKAEFVGIVRLSRPSVKAGTVLGGDRELAYVESLGIRNPVRSGGPGRIVEIFVTDGQPVEYGQPLFAIEK